MIYGTERSTTPVSVQRPAQLVLPHTNALVLQHTLTLVLTDTRKTYTPPRSLALLEDPSDQNIFESDIAPATLL